MGNYLSGADFQEKFHNDLTLAMLTDSARSGEREVDTDAVERAIVAAENEINGRLDARYGPLPFSPVPELIVSLTFQLATCYLYEFLGEDIKCSDLRQRADTILTNLATGKERLRIPAGGEATSAPETVPTIAFDVTTTPLTDTLNRLKP